MMATKNMETDNTKVIDVCIEKGDVEKIKESIVYMIRPHWKSLDVHEEQYGHGYVNQMLRYSRTLDTDKEDAIVVRIFGDIAKMQNRDREVAAMQIGHLVGCFPKLLAVFVNGVAYEYAHGKTLTSHDIADPTILRPLGRSLAKFHSADLDNIQVIGLRGERNTSLSGESLLFKQFRSRIDGASHKLTDAELQQRGLTQLPSLQYLMGEVQYFESMVDELEFAHTGLLHCDFHGWNILHDSRSGTFTFVDLELARGGPVAYDLAYLYAFCQAAFMSIPNLGGPPDDTLLEAISKGYLEEKYKQRADDSSHVDERELRLLVLEAKIMDQFMPLTFVMWGYLLIAAPSESLDGLRLVESALPLYDRSRTTVEKFREEYIKLKTQAAHLHPKQK